MKLISEYPWWFYIFCLLLGALYAFVLYWRDNRFSEIGKTARRTMTALRFVAVSLIAFLLLSPLIRTVFRTVEKPLIVIAQDNSESIVVGKDSSFYRNEYKAALSKLIDDLGDEFEVKTYSFGDRVEQGVSHTYKEKQTDLDQLFDEIEIRHSNRNLGAVVVASDGLYNKGSNPLYANIGIKAPVYTVALGDTNLKKDLIIAKVAHNRLAYLGNTFPFEILVDAKKSKGSATELKVFKGKQVFFSKRIDVTSDNFSLAVPVQLEAKETGLQRYRISLSNIRDEASYTNNIQNVFIDVLDARQKILILAATPHPDIAAFRQILEKNDNYEVDLGLIDDFNKPIAKYNLVIFHQVPSARNNGSKIFSEFNKSGAAGLFVLGNQSTFDIFNSLNSGITITGVKSKFNDALPVFNKGFSLFSVSDNTAAFLNKFPPLQAPYGNYRLGNAANVFLSQRIGMVPTEDPLIVFPQNGDKKTGIITGEGIWRWQLEDFKQHQNHEIFNEVIGKIVQYLSVKEDKSLFRVFGKNNFLENEVVELSAELYNNSYELVNEAEVNVTIINEENKKFPFTFSKTSNAYALNAGRFPVGEYRYEAQVKLGNKVLTDRGEFSISPLQVETINTVADHQLLNNLSAKHGGQMVYPNELDKLRQLLLNREDITSVAYSKTELKEIIHIKWIFFLLLVLLSAEWFMRKRSGGY